MTSKYTYLGMGGTVINMRFTTANICTSVLLRKIWRSIQN